MKDEILNIEYHTCRLILKALNSEKQVKAASLKLGITTRSVHRKFSEYGIVKKNNVFIAENKPKYVILKPQ